MDNDMEMYLEKVLKKTDPKKYIEILEQDREDFAKEIVKLNQRINKATEIYKNRNTCKYKKERFVKDKSTSDLMYEALQGSDKE